MKTAFAGRLVALTMLAGLVTAALPIHAEPVQAALTWQAAEACAGPAAAQSTRASDAALATAAFEGNGSELELLGGEFEPLPLNLGEEAAVAGCSPRRCHAGFISIGCCGRFRTLGIDYRGECTVRERCDP